MISHAGSPVEVLPMLASATAAPSSLLFIRSVPLPATLRMLRLLRHAYPKAHLTVLTSPGTIAAITAEQVVDCIIPYVRPRFGLLAAGPKLLWQLRCRRFDRVLVPYVGPSWRPFWNVGRMAGMATGKETLWLPCDPASAGNLEICHRVSLAEWLSQLQSVTGVRWLVLQALKWPFLCLFYLVAILFLSVLALLLIPLVWLKPAEDGVGR